MNRTRNLKNWDRGSIFRKVSASLTVLLFLASTNLSTAALAEGARHAALEQFKLDNPGVAHKELHQMFKQEWSTQKNRDSIRGFVSPIQSSPAAIDNSHNHNHVNRNDFSTRAEFQAAKHAMKFQPQNLDDVRNHTVQQIGNKFVNINSGLALDLGSAVETITLGDRLFNQQESVVINVGGQNRTLGAGSKVTAAEYIAAKQVMGGGSQTVTLDANGRAVGGEVDLSAMTNGGANLKVSDLSVPVAVTASGEFGRGGDVRLSGDLTNSGIINAYTSKQGQVSALIKADNITNTNSGAIKSSVSDLTLQADKSLVNDGTIYATGNLTVSGGETLTNSGTMSSLWNLNVQSPEVTNSGRLVSMHGNVNLNTPVAQEMKVNNTGGTISALGGAINIRDAAYVDSFNSTVTGGDLLSKEVNAYTGAGTTNVHVNQLTGVLNTNGSAAHVSADTGTLILGNQCLVDDPTYFNTGNILLTGNITVGENLAIIAGGNITTSQNSLSILARNGSVGQNIVMVAGANVTGSGSQASSLSGNPPSGNAASASFSGPSSTGGNINLSGVIGNSFIDARGTGNGNGGNITLAAFANASGSNGAILLNNLWEVNASGAGTGTNGNINVMAGAKSGNAIVLGKVITNNNNQSGGISIGNFQPGTSNGLAITYDGSGSVSSGNSLVATSTRGSGNVSVQFASTRGNIDISSGSDFSNTLDTGALEAGSSGAVKLNAGGDLSVSSVTYLNQGSTGSGTFLATSGDNITFSGSIRANGGLVAVASNDLIALNGTSLFTEKAGDTGSLSLIAGADFQVNANSVTILGQSSSVAGGSINFNNSTTDKISKLSASSPDSGAGGEVNLIAYGGTIHLPGTFPGNSSSFSVAADSNNTDNGNHSNGTINIVAGLGSDAIQMGGASTTGTANSTGTINIFAGVPNNNVNISTSGTTFGKSQSAFIDSNSVATGGVLVTRTLTTSGGDIRIAGGNYDVQFADVTNWHNFEVTTRANIINQGASSTALLTGAGDRDNTLLWTAEGNISFSGRIKLHASGSGITPVAGGGGIVIVAGGTVQSVDNNGGFTGPDVESNSGYNGGNIVIVAGANFTRSGSTISIDGNSGKNGSILFDDSTPRVDGFNPDNVNLVDSHSTPVQTSFLNGGDITLVAYNQILLDTTPNPPGLSAAGGSFLGAVGQNGNVTIVAPNVISIPKVDMAQNRGGSVTVRAATPSTGTINIPHSTAFGTITGGSFTSGALSSAALNLSASDFLGSSYSLVTNGNITVANINLSSTAAGLPIGTVNLQAGGTVTAGNIDVHSSVAGVAAGTVFIQGSSVVVGTINASHTLTAGDAGSVTLITNSSTALQSGTGSAGTNRTGAIDIRVAGGFAGNGGTLNLTNNGGGVTLLSAPTFSVTQGSGAHLAFSSSGVLDITPLGSTIDVSAKAPTLANLDGGSLSLKFASLVSAPALQISADATGTTGHGGTISIERTAGNLTLDSSGGFQSISTNAGSSNLRGTINVKSNAILQVSSSSLLTAADYSFTGSTVTLQKSLSGTNLTVVATGSADLQADQSVSGSIKIFTSSVNGNNLNLSANDIKIEASSVGFFGSSFTFNSVEKTLITATSGILNMSSGGTVFTFNGGVILSANAQGAILFAGGSSFNTDTQSYIVTGNLNGGSIGAEFTPGGLWTLTNSGMYANNPGPVTLSGVINFAGSDFAIISTGNIDLTGATINLSDLTNSGNLTLLAGFDFTPGTSSQQTFSTGTYTNFTATGSGSILGFADVNLIGNNGNGGNLIAFANGGVVQLGNVSTQGNSGGNGGNVTIVGSQGIAVGNINTNGALKGDVSLDVADPIVSAGFAITSGTISSGSVLPPTSLNSGNISFGQIVADDFVIRAGLTSSDTITNSGNLFANHIVLKGFAGTTTLNGVNAPIFDSICSGGNVTVNAGTNIAFNLSNVQNFTGTSSGDVTVATTLGQQTSVSLTANSIDASSGLIVAGNASLTTTGGNLTGIVSASTLTINTSGSVGNGVSRFSTNADSIDLHSGTFVSMTSTNASGVNFTTAESGAGQLFDLIASGPVSGSIETDSLSITTSGSDVGSSTNPLSLSSKSGGLPVTMTVTTGAGNVFVDNDGSGDLIINGASGNSLTVVGAGFSSKVRFEGTQTSFNGDINVTSDYVLNNTTVSSANGDINIHHLGVGGLQIVGGSGPTEGFWNAANGMINVIGDSAVIFLQGDTTYLSTALLQSNQILVSSGTSTATANSYLVTPNLQFVSGSLATLGTTWFIVNPGTLGNNPGDVNLTASETFNGGNYAILAAGNINLNNITITLADSTSGGSLTMIAGYNFSANTGGTQQLLNGLTIDSFTPSTSGGSITGAADIDLHGVSGSGGKLIAVAHAGTVNAGSISLGNIDTRGNSTGGDVLLIGEGGVTVGAVDATNASGGAASGSIGLYSAIPVVPTGAGFQVFNGIATGTVSAGSSTNHAISTGSLNAGRNSVDVIAGTGAGAAVSVGSALTANQITMQGNTISFGFSNLLASATAGQSGDISLKANTITGSSSSLTIDTNGAVSGVGGSIDLTLLSSAASTFGTGGNFQLVAGAVLGAGVAGQASITSNGDVILNSNAVNTAGLNDAGSITVNTAGNLTVNSGSLVAKTGSGDGASFTLNAGNDGSGTLLLNDVSFFSQANGSGNGDGGRLQLFGPVISTPGFGTSSATPLSLTATGAGTGDGGDVSFRTFETVSTFIGASAKAPRPPVRFLQAFAGGGGDAGSITIETGGNLTVNNVGLVDASTNGSAGGVLDGAEYTLKAGTIATGALIINGSLNANGIAGGDAGKIELSSRSSTAFSVNPTKLPRNGIFGTLSANGNNGKIVIENEAGGILVGSNVAFNTPDLELTAGGAKGAITAGAFAISASNSILLQASSGALGGKRALFVNTPELIAVTNGLVGITNNFAGPSVVRNSFGGTGFTLKTASSVTVENSLSTTLGSILISAASGELAVADNAVVTANNGALTLQVVGTGAGSRITIGDNATAQTLGAGKTTSLVIGPVIPKTGTNPAGPGNTPVGMNTSVTVGNFIFLGPANSVAIPVGTANVTAKNQNVIFNNLSAAGELITLGNGSLVMADPPAAGVQPSIAARGTSAQTLAAAIPVVASDSLDSPATSLSGFAGENFAHTVDLSVVSLKAPQQLHTESNSRLLTLDGSANGPAMLTAWSAGGSLTPSGINVVTTARVFGSTEDNADDNSYAVGFCPMTGEADGAICSDSLVLADAVGETASIQKVEHSDHVVIKKGSVLFVPFKATTVETPNGIVHIDAKSVVLVSSTDAGLAVYDLEDQHKGSVSVESSGHNVVLSPGRHVMVTKHHTAEFAQINAVETIAHRNVQSTVKNGHRAHTSEFSILTAVDTVRPLKALAMSKHANAKQIADRMLKTTAIILQIGGTSGPYQHYFKPRMTAMQK